MNFEKWVNRAYIDQLVEQAKGGQDAGKLEIDRIDLNTARAFAEALFKAHDRDLDQQLPEFDQNFLLAKSKARIGKTRRRDMPVINDHQVREFQARLKAGKLDTHKPFAPGTNDNNPWPQGLSGKDAKHFVEKGLKDKNLKDDVIKVANVKQQAQKLKPIQLQIYFDKSLAGIAQFGVAASRSFFQKSLNILSGDEYIIDGHHRWLATLLIDPKIMVSGVKIDLPISKLLPVSLAYGDSIGNKRNK